MNEKDQMLCALLNLDNTKVTENKCRMLWTFGERDSHEDSTKGQRSNGIVNKKA